MCIITKPHKTFSFTPNVAQYIWNLYVQYILLYTTLDTVLMKILLPLCLGHIIGNNLI